jgi:hypothetical protein
MIYLFHGSDGNKVRAKAFAWVAAARAKAPDAGYIRLTADALTPEALGEAMGSQGLFFAKTLVLLDDPFSEGESGELVLDMLADLAASPNPIAIVAPKLLAARIKKIEAKAEKVFELSSTEKKVARGFNSNLVNALAAKDAEALWKEIVKAERAGDVPEMIHGLLHWKARDMMQKGNRAWGADGARKLSRDLIELLSDARGGDLPLGPALERFALSLK